MEKNENIFSEAIKKPRRSARYVEIPLPQLAYGDLEAGGGVTTFPFRHRLQDAGDGRNLLAFWVIINHFNVPYYRKIICQGGTFLGRIAFWFTNYSQYDLD